MNKFSLVFLMVLITLGSCSKRFKGIGRSTISKKHIEVKELDFEYLSAKAKINFKDNRQDVKAKANIRIKKDSLIWINFSAVGIQGARCLFTKDSISMINIVKKEYYKYTYSEFTEKFNFKIDYNIIEDIIIGELPFALSPEDKVSSEGGMFVVKKEQGEFLLSTSINKESKQVEKVEISGKDKKSNLKIDYKDYHSAGNASFPFKILVDLTFENTKGTVYTYVDLEYNKTVIEEKPLKFPFNIPKRYVRK